MDDHVESNQVEDLAGLLKSMSHPIRLKILCLLQDQELSVSEIRDSVETTGANITQHLNILRNQNIIDYRKDANFIYNRISDERVITLIQTMQQIFCKAETEEP
ncbi:MAG: metalloregulator ArsR/SmtB family transcription factor [Desulfobulbaceae bacterium]|nr:metalloregulator ArsR/SmtB family transcription factor [Desulfobulbaceae bacterium]